MPYTYISYTDAVHALAQRLYDWGLPAPMQFHSANEGELGTYIGEAIQTFNVFANFYRQEFTFNAEFGQPWYDIASPEVPYSLRQFNTDDLSLIVQIEFHLLEPPTVTYPLTWTGTRQFTLTDILNAIQQGRDKVLSEGGCTVSQRYIEAVPGRTFLDDNVMSVRRVCWVPNIYQSDFTINCLLPSDLWATQSFLAAFPQRGAGTPLTYRRSTEPPVSFDVDIDPAVNGQYDILTVNNDVALSTAHNTMLPVPDDWCHAIKYEALAQLFGRESLAKDALRQDYCENRYKQYMALMQTAPAVLGARVNNAPVIVDAISNGDFYDANWQGKLLARPRRVYYSGLNMLALSPIPDATPYSVTIECVRNMPLPQSGADFLQIGRDDIKPVLDLAQHIAMLKVGGEEFTRTYPFFKNFLRHCSLYNSKLKAHSQWWEWLDRRPQEEIHVNPIFQQPDPATVEQGALNG